jgi:hypothetical protein
MDIHQILMVDDGARDPSMHLLFSRRVSIARSLGQPNFTVLLTAYPNQT